MPFIIYGLAILVGFVLGYFFNTMMIIIFSVCTAILAVIYRPKREQEIGALIGVIVWIVLGVAFVVMWGTHFYATGTFFGFSNLSQYILRK